MGPMWRRCSSPRRTCGSVGDFVDVVRAVLGPRALVGATASSVIGGAEEIEESPAVVVVGRARRRRATRFASTRTRAATAGRSPVCRTTSAGDRARWCCSPTRDSFPTDAFLRQVAHEAPAHHRDRRVGLGGARPGGNRLVLDGLLLDEGAVGFLLEDASARVVVSQGCRPIGDPFIVTRADHNFIQELGGRPALERVQQLIDSATPADRVVARRGLHVGIVIDERKDEFTAATSSCATCSGADRELGAVAVGDLVDVGTTVQFHVRDAVTADEDLRDDARRSGGRVGVGVHLQRARSALVRRTRPRRRAGAEAARGGAVAGMFCAGEIGPVGGRTFLHGFTASGPAVRLIVRSTDTASGARAGRAVPRRRRRGTRSSAPVVRATVVPMEPMPPLTPSTLLTPARAGRVLAYCVLALPAGAVGLALLVAGWSLTLALAVTPAGVGVLVLFAAALRVVAGVESAMAAALLGVLRRRATPRPASGYWRRGPAVLGDSTFWKHQLFLFVRVILGWPIGIALVSLFGSALGLIVAPVYYRWLPIDGGGHGFDYGVCVPADTFVETLALVPAGLVLFGITYALLGSAGTMWQHLAGALLPGRMSAMNVSVPDLRQRRRALAVHGIVTLMLTVLLTGIWGLTTRVLLAVLACARARLGIGGSRVGAGARRAAGTLATGGHDEGAGAAPRVHRGRRGVPRARVGRHDTLVLLGPPGRRSGCR